MSGIGIHDLSVATGHHVLDLALMAEHLGIDPAKYHVGIGQDEMSIPAPDEDVVTMAAAAALPILERHGTDGIRTVLFATESGIDQSKSAGLFVHQLLELPSACRVLELKQACYSATAGIQLATGLVQRHPEERVLVIASDVARYALGSSGEPTQGAGAVAMLIGADPAILEVESVTGVHATDVDDFWRPNDHDTALVDGRLSITAYLTSLRGAWDDFRAHGGVGLEDIDHVCYHQPFSKMAVKAHAQLGRHAGTPTSAEDLEIPARYNRRIGNSYSASLYLALAALLDSDQDLAGRRIGFFSYGSGSVGEFFTARVAAGYRSSLRPGSVPAALDARAPLDFAAYRDLHVAAAPGSSTDRATESVTNGPFRFAGVRGAVRRYEPTR